MCTHICTTCTHVTYKHANVYEQEEQAQSARAVTKTVTKAVAHQLQHTLTESETFAFILCAVFLRRDKVCALLVPYVYVECLMCMCMPYVYALYVCLMCMPHVYALCVCLMRMPYMYALYVCLMRMPYVSALCVFYRSYAFYMS